MSKNILFSVDGFSVLENTVYRVKPKKDFNVPEEMQRKGYNKYPGSPHFICLNATGNVYDTGFEKTDKQYVSHRNEIKEEIVKQRRSNVLVPYLQSLGFSEERFRSSSFEDWDEVKVRVDELRTFNTNNVKDTLELYVCLISGSIVPPEANEFDSKYDGAYFKLLDTKTSRKREDESVELKMRVTSNFYMLYENDIERLINILVGMGYTELYRGRADKSVLIQYLDSKILKSTSKKNEFLELFDLSKSENGKDELKLFRILFLAYRTKHNDFGRGDGFLTYKGEVLGRNEKETAEMLANNNNYEDMRISILLDDTLK
jgi:hypothetical protein